MIMTKFLSTPPSRVATPHQYQCGQSESVSIHATLAGGDPALTTCTTASMCFYPRHPRGWRRQNGHTPRDDGNCFYPRHPRGWRRWAAGGQAVSAQCFYPRHPRGWRLGGWRSSGIGSMFLSTPPSRVATATVRSTHSRQKCFYPRHPRGWRQVAGQRVQVVRGFYPRHPRGWRRQGPTDWFC